jgi:DNA (cytosine-5)-methyltransferase 1
MSKNENLVIDLFCGCGGMSLGFERAGFKTILAIDIDENCEKTYTKNFGNGMFKRIDLSKLTDKEIKNLTNGVKPEVIIGGPPCQGFSLANKRRNSIKDDPRNKLFYEFVRFIDIYKPKVFLMENVTGLLSMKSGEVIKLIMNEFENAGNKYYVDKRVLNAANYGVPQLRNRVFILGIRRDLGVMPSFPEKLSTSKVITVWDAISDLPQIVSGEGKYLQEYSKRAKNQYQREMRNNSDFIYNHVAMRHTPRLVERFKVIKFGQSLKDVPVEHSAVKRGAPKELSNIVFSQNNKRLFPDKPAPTIAASFQSNFIHPYLNRNFTAREGARLQSFPDSFVFEGMKTKMSWEKGLSQYQQIGNAVPPLLANAIAKYIKQEILEKRNYRRDQAKTLLKELVV